MNTEAPPLHTLQDAYSQWLAAPRARQPELTNAERSLPDRLNHERALKCLAAGQAGAACALEAAPATLLDTLDMILAKQVEAGAKLLNAHAGRAEPSDKTIRNLVAGCRAVRNAAYPEGIGRRVKNPRKVLAERPKRKYRPAFPRERWPERLKLEWADYYRWKTKDRLAPGEGARLRRKACKPITLEAHAKRVTPLIRYLVDHQGITDLGLLDLIDLERYYAYSEWYLSEDADGGFHTAQDTATTLATITQYLVANGELTRPDPDEETPWRALYRAGNEVLAIGAAKGELPQPREVNHWTPQDMRTIALKGWNEPVPRYQNGDGRKRQRRVFSYHRNALFFALATEAPLRARNYREMIWHKNLKRTPTGLWEVSFRGHELKVATRNNTTNEYTRTFSPLASSLINRWRNELNHYFGPNFETTAPHVFASADQPTTPISHPAFHTGIEAYALEQHGHPFHPHDARRIVATNLIARYGLDGAHLAATLLGDTLKVVLDTYYRPNDDNTLTNYLNELDKAA